MTTTRIPGSSTPVYLLFGFASSSIDAKELSVLVLALGAKVGGFILTKFASKRRFFRLSRRTVASKVDLSIRMLRLQTSPAIETVIS